MRINRAQIKHTVRVVRIRQANKHRPIDRRVAIKRVHIGLQRHAGRRAIRALRHIHQRTVRDVELRRPHHILGIRDLR